MARLSANGATTRITRMTALLMAITAQAGSPAAYLSAPAPGITGAGAAEVTAGVAATAIAPAGAADIAAAMATAAAMVEHGPAGAVANIAMAADMAAAMPITEAATAADSAPATAVTLAVAADSTAVAVADSTVAGGGRRIPRRRWPPVSFHRYPEDARLLRQAGFLFGAIGPS